MESNIQTPTPGSCDKALCCAGIRQLAAGHDWDVTTMPMDDLLAGENYDVC